MAPELVYHVSGDRVTYPVEQDEITIGRAADNDLVVQDVSISRHHARVWRDGESWRVEDLGSKNGTCVNDGNGGDRPLQDGDEIVLGKFPMTFLVERSRSGVELTAAEAEANEEGGTIFRSAVDFQALAGGTSPAEAAAPALSVERLQKLLQIVTQASEALMASTALEDTLEKVLDLVFEHLPVSRGFIMLWEEAQQELAVRCVRDRSDSQQADEIKFSRTIAEKVYRDKVSVLTTDAQSDPRFAGGASIMALGIRSAMAAPLWNKDNVEGLIYVDTPLHVRAFDDFDLDLLSALGNHVAVALERSRLQESVVEEQLSRTRLERYHSPAVVERIKNEASDMLAAEEREATVLFADIVGFTERCETLEPRQVAEMLNRCFGCMAECVFKHEGTLDKFIGDCLMAVFGAPLEMPDHPLRAVSAALDIREALAELNEQLPAAEQVLFRVGMHSGRVVAGDIGSVRRRDYTVLGATVNLASRMESSVARPGQIVVSDSTYQAVEDRFVMECVGEYQPKGISRLVKAYEVVGRR